MKPPEITTLTLGPKGAALVAELERHLNKGLNCGPQRALFLAIHLFSSDDPDEKTICHLALEATEEAEQLGL